MWTACDFSVLTLSWVLKRAHGSLISRATSIFLQETFDPECLKDRKTPSEPESFSDKPPAEPHAQKARVKHTPLQPGQDPLGHTPVLRLVGVLLCVSLRTRPDISWAVAG